jgi:peptidyl-dipeptidase Dcp
MMIGRLRCRGFGTVLPVIRIDHPIDTRYPLPDHMRIINTLALAVAVLVCGARGADAQDNPHQMTQTTPVATETTNPLLQEWAGPYGGVPPFDQVQVAHFKPALEWAMADELSEIDAIAGNPEAPTFQNTILALERSGEPLNRVRTVYGIWSSSMNSPDFREVEREMAPRLAAFSDQITQNEALFGRIDALYNSPEKDQLTPEQQRLVWLYHNNFVRAGARLDEAAKNRLSEINQELAGLFTRFSQNVLSDENDRYILIEREIDLSGLPNAQVDAAAAEAEARGYAGQWAVANTRSAMEPFLTYADNREFRQQAFELFANRGDFGDENDNNAIITEILQLRAERAALLGYDTHAHWRLENTMMGDPYAALELMEAVWMPAVARVEEEVADMQALANELGHDITIEPWDYRYYAEKVRKERYDLDEGQVSEYLQLDNMVEGMFWVGGELFGMSFSEVSNVPVYHEDVRVWEVSDRSSGEHIGLFYFDPYARQGKRSGAWMNAYRRQHRIDGDVTTIVSNNSNFVKGRPGEPVLISWTDASTLFHEFGHALHGLASDVTYPSLSGTAVARDYVEFPSQLLEHWLATPEVLNRFALHYQTGEPIPHALVDRIEEAATFNEGFRTTEFLASGLMDMRYHLEGDRRIDPRAFERDVLSEYGLPSEIVMRHRSPHFLHVFASDGYSAGYYSYLWSDVLTADAWEAFIEGEGAYDGDVARRLTEHVFSVGNTIDPADGYREFRGRDPEVRALMEKRGFPTN